MKLLASKIACELKALNYCVVSEAELSRGWPRYDKDREGKMKEFARRNGLQGVRKLAFLLPKEFVPATEPVSETGATFLTGYFDYEEKVSEWFGS